MNVPFPREPVTFQRAIGLSLAVHVLLFGSALTFAHITFAHPLWISSISVILVEGRSAERPSHRATSPSLREEFQKVSEERAKRAVLEEENIAPPGHSAEIMVNKEYRQAEERAGDSDDGGAPHGYSKDDWLLLQEALERAKSYPRLAREHGIEGTVLLRFKVRTDGTIEHVNVVKSSGAKILDEASVRSVYQAAPVPYVAGWVEVPLVYKLRNGDR